MDKIIEILKAFRDNTEVPKDNLTNAIVDKLFRRGLLGKDVVTGKVALSDYGRRKMALLNVDEA